MSELEPFDEEYPGAGQCPESDWHNDLLIDLLRLLKSRYEAEQTSVTSGIEIYYSEGRPYRGVAPDIYVVKDYEPRSRRTFKVWKERRIPNLVFEITSSLTKREDERLKIPSIEEMRIPEYFVFDSVGEYRSPPLQGFRHTEGKYRPIEPDHESCLASNELGLMFRRNGWDLEMAERETGQRLYRTDDLENCARVAVQSRWRDAEDQVRFARETMRELRERFGDFVPERSQVPTQPDSRNGT